MTKPDRPNWNPSTNVIQPAPAVKTTGFVVEKPPFQYFNWFWKNISDWITYIDSNETVEKAVQLYESLPLDNVTLDIGNDTQFDLAQTFLSKLMATKGTVTLQFTGAYGNTRINKDLNLVNINGEIHITREGGGGNILFRKLNIRNCKLVITQSVVDVQSNSNDYALSVTNSSGFLMVNASNSDSSYSKSIRITGGSSISLGPSSIVVNNDGNDYPVEVTGSSNLTLDDTFSVTGDRNKACIKVNNDSSFSGLNYLDYDKDNQKWIIMSPTLEKTIDPLDFTIDETNKTDFYDWLNRGDSVGVTLTNANSGIRIYGNQVYEVDEVYAIRGIFGDGTLEYMGSLSIDGSLGLYQIDKKIIFREEVSLFNNAEDTGLDVSCLHITNCSTVKFHETITITVNDSAEARSGLRIYDTNFEVNDVLYIADIDSPLLSDGDNASKIFVFKSCNAEIHSFVRSETVGSYDYGSEDIYLGAILGGTTYIRGEGDSSSTANYARVVRSVVAYAGYRLGTILIVGDVSIHDVSLELAPRVTI